jgi:hypothetical protein
MVWSAFNTYTMAASACLAEASGSVSGLRFTRRSAYCDATNDTQPLSTK